MRPRPDRAETKYVNGGNRSTKESGMGDCKLRMDFRGYTLGTESALEVTSTHTHGRNAHFPFIGRLSLVQKLKSEKMARGRSRLANGQPLRLSVMTTSQSESLMLAVKR